MSLLVYFFLGFDFLACYEAYVNITSNPAN